MYQDNARRIWGSIMPLVIVLMTSLSLFSNSVYARKELIGAAQQVESIQGNKTTKTKRLAYLVSDSRIPFWDIMARGIKYRAASLGYSVDIYSANNSTKAELENTVKVLQQNISGIIVSPTTSSACVTILKLAAQKHIPVVISDIGTDSGEYVSFISSDNRDGAYQIGKVLVEKYKQLGWKKNSVGIVAIPQKRLNGQARTEGFLQAMNEAGVKGNDIRQQVDFSEEETYRLSKDIIKKHPDINAIWLQGSNRYKAALHAIDEAGKKDKILLLTFDAEPEFLGLIPDGVLIGSAMQQPYLMGQQAVSAMHNHLTGKPVKKNSLLPVLAISADNIQHMLPVIKKNVLGIEE